MPRDRFKLIEEVHAENAEDFLDLLTPQRGGPLWRNRIDQGSWIFRGQEDASWKLVPSALRGGDPWHKFRIGQLTPIPRSDPQEIIDAEEHFVLNFANHASALGYEIPFDSSALRDKDRQRERNDANHFPLAEYRGIWALAQHYGVPTRLLDWSEKPLVSAYFAAINLAKNNWPNSPAGEKRLAVWALSRWFVERHEVRERNPSVVIVTVPKLSNPHLRAQAGLFTLVRFTEGPTRLPPALDDLLSDDDLTALAWDTEGVPRLPMLYKITCPQADVRVLLHYLHLSGIDAATIYSGHGSIEAAMQEGRYRTIIGREVRRPRERD